MNEGFVSLTDMHKKLGGEIRKLPNKFTVRFKELIGTEILIKKGRHGGGTWASPRIAEYYEKWATEYCDEFHLRSFCQRESAALLTIEQIKGITLNRQFSVLGYRVDGYDEINNVAYEIDENHHKKTQHRAKDGDRQRAIIAALNCDFIRVKV